MNPQPKRNSVVASLRFLLTTFLLLAQQSPILAEASTIRKRRRVKHAGSPKPKPVMDGNPAPSGKATRGGGRNKHATISPTANPTPNPSTGAPSPTPSLAPSSKPSDVSSSAPSSEEPTLSPVDGGGVVTSRPTTSPTESPTISPTTSPTTSPTNSPTISPTKSPSASPTISPTDDNCPAGFPDRPADTECVPNGNQSDMNPVDDCTFPIDCCSCCCRESPGSSGNGNKCVSGGFMTNPALCIAQPEPQRRLAGRRLPWE
mmetsp:Transcript_4296/g.9228  ORF Transcript_4296/g.9228 Transcript_4296/m.9228 type:complete len:260 (-) Transcript_4296:299-1078(-)